MLRRDGDDGRGGERDHAPLAPRQSTGDSRPPPKTQQSNYDDDMRGEKTTTTKIKMMMTATVGGREGVG